MASPALRSSSSGLLSESTGGDLIHVAFPASGGPGAGEHPADLFHRSLRAKVLRSDEKHNAADESEGVLQHQPLHFAVVATAPVGSGQERPADLHFVSLSVVPVKSRGTDHPLRDRITGDQCAAGRQCLVKEHPEACDLVAGFVRMLLPDQRVGSDRVQIIVVLRTKRPELDEISLQNRLPIERQRQFRDSLDERSLGLRVGLPIKSVLNSQPSFQRLVLTGNIRMRTQIIAERNSTGPLRRPIGMR